MGRRVVERKGPVLTLSRNRRRSARLRAILEQEHFDVIVVASAAELAAREAELGPTVIILDWGSDDEPSREELVHRFRTRRRGPRLVVVAEAGEAAALAGSTAVHGVIGAALEAEEVVDVVWRAHHEAIDARSRT